MSRPHITLTDAQRAEVETLAAVLNAEQIADFLGFGRTTFFALLNRDPDLAERYRRGKARAVGAVAQSLVTKARSGNVPAMIFYLKTQGGWRETVEMAAPVPQPEPERVIDLSLLSMAALKELHGAVVAAQAPEAIDLEKDDRNGRWTVA